MLFLLLCAMTVFMYLLVEKNDILGVYHKRCFICLVLVFALALFPGSSLGNSGIASACHEFYAIKLFHYIPHYNLFHANILAAVSS